MEGGVVRGWDCMNGSSNFCIFFDFCMYGSG